ncbi:MAG TPA: WYL domain-containing protein [Chloroflexia bacterium]|jgi:predicted DNA-binding transcriptional regulator YafY
MRADRLLSLLMLLQARGRMTAAELAEELEVSERTIYRDLEALNASGVPVLAERGPGGGVLLPDKYRTDLTGLTEAEVRGLFISVVPGPLSELGLDKAIEAAMLKLSASLPAVQRQGVERVRGRVHVDTAHWFQPPEPVPYLKPLQEAVWQNRRVILKYRASSGTRSRTYINPYGLVAKAGIWYLVGVPLREKPAYGVSRVQEARQETRVFRVSRITEAEVTGEQFEREEHFDLAGFWQAWCADFEASLPRYRVVLRVPPDMVPMLPNIYGDGVRTLIAEQGRTDEDGSLILPMTFESFEAARSNVLGLVTGAEVLEPQELRDSVMRAAASIVAFYTGGSAKSVMRLIGSET